MNVIDRVFHRKACIGRSTKQWCKGVETTQKTFAHEHDMEYAGRSPRRSVPSRVLSQSNPPTIPELVPDECFVTAGRPLRLVA